MFDIFSNHKIVNLRTHASQSIGAAYQPAAAGKDLMAENPNFLGQRERTRRGLLLVEVTDVGTGGTLDVVVQDSPDGTTWDADFNTLAQIDSTGLYAADIKDIERYIRLSATAGTDAVVWGAKMIGFEAARRPVYQADATLITVTTGSGR